MSKRPCASSLTTSRAAATKRWWTTRCKFDRLDLARTGHEGRGGGNRRGRESLQPRDARRARIRPRPHRGLSSPPDAEGRSLHRRAWRRARLALDGDRSRRTLRPGRHGGLSVIGADERRAGQGRRRAADRRWWCPRPIGELSPLVLAAAKPRRRRRDLPHRRRAGGRGARLWHADDRAGRQDRRTRQCLCRGGEAHRVRQGRHRHDRRPLRSADHRRQGRQSGLDRRRSSGASRA